MLSGPLLALVAVSAPGAILLLTAPPGDEKVTLALPEGHSPFW